MENRVFTTTFVTQRKDEKGKGAWRGYVKYYDMVPNPDYDPQDPESKKTIKKYGRKSYTLKVDNETEAKAAINNKFADLKNDYENERRELAIAELQKAAGITVHPDSVLYVVDYVSQYVENRHKAGGYTSGAKNGKAKARPAIEDSTYRDYQYAIKKMRDGGLDKVTVGELTTDIVQDWVNDMSAAGLSYSPIHKSVRLLSGAMKRAVATRVRTDNPCDLVDQPRKANVKPGINSLNAAGYGQMTQKLDDAEPSETVIAATIALKTGLRIGEVCGLQWRDVDFNKLRLHVRNAIGYGGSASKGHYLKDPKSHKPRALALSPALAKRLKARLEKQEAEFFEAGLAVTGETFITANPVCACKGEGHFNPNTMGKQWSALAHVFGIKGSEGRIPTFHDLRHTYATLAIANGVDVRTVAEALGHKDVTVTLNTYTAVDEDAQRRCADLMDRLGSGEGGDE